MANLSDEEKRAIIERDLPGYRIVEGGGTSKSIAPDAPEVKPEGGTPDVAALRRKYFGEEAADETGTPEAVGSGATSKGLAPPDDDDEIVPAEPTNKRDAWDRGSRPKSVVISGSQKKIIGSQG